MVEEIENKNKNKICISLPSEKIKAIDEKRGLIPRSPFILEMIDKALLEKAEIEEKEEQA